MPDRTAELQKFYNELFEARIDKLNLIPEEKITLATATGSFPLSGIRESFTPAFKIKAETPGLMMVIARRNDETDLVIDVMAPWQWPLAGRTIHVELIGEPRFSLPSKSYLHDIKLENVGNYGCARSVVLDQYEKAVSLLGLTCGLLAYLKK